MSDDYKENWERLNKILKCYIEKSKNDASLTKDDFHKGFLGGIKIVNLTMDSLLTDKVSLEDVLANFYKQYL